MRPLQRFILLNRGDHYGIMGFLDLPNGLQRLESYRTDADAPRITQFEHGEGREVLRRTLQTAKSRGWIVRYDGVPNYG